MLRQLSTPSHENEDETFSGSRLGGRSEDVNGSGMEWTESRKQLKTVQMFLESDAVLGARAAVFDGGHGVRCPVRTVDMLSQTVM